MSGKGSNRRQEDVRKVRSNWDLIDWSKKRESAEPPKQPENQPQSPSGDNKG